MSVASSSPQSPSASSEKSSYAGAAWQMMYNAKAAVSQALRKELKQTLDTSNIHALGQEGRGEEWLQQYCKSVQYFSYRNKLPTPIGADLDHDAGWGCMVRTGQMMLCVALKRAMKMVYGGGGKNDTISTATFIDVSPHGGDGNSISISNNNNGYHHHHHHSHNNNSNGTNSNLHATTMSVDGSTVDLSTLPSHEERVKAVVGMFRDIPSADFSIYAIVNAGAKFHIQPGEWFNATSLALSLKHLIVARDSCLVTAVHGKESTVELSDVITSASLGKPVLVMVSVMLGLNNISKTYFPAVHEILGHETSVGIVGGKPKKSMYFFASQKETLFMLDPHYVQPAFTHKTPIGLAYGNMDWVPMGEADSSMLLCFLLEPTETAIENWAQWGEKKVPTLSEYPTFCISRKKMKKQSTATMFKNCCSQNNHTNNIHNNNGSHQQQSVVAQKKPATTTTTTTKPKTKNEDEDDFDTMDDFDENGESPSLPKNSHADHTFQRTPPMGPQNNNSTSSKTQQQQQQQQQQNSNSNTTTNSGGLDLDDLLGNPVSNTNNNNNSSTSQQQQQQQASSTAATSFSTAANEPNEIGFDDL